MAREPTKIDLADLKVGKQIKDMMASEGWKTYERLLRKHIDDKVRAALQPISPVVQPDMTVVMPDGVTHVLLGEAAKGAIIGLRLALELPSGIVQQMQDLRQQLFPGETASDED